MLSQETAAKAPQVQIWPIERLVEYRRNPRKNDSAVDRMCGSICEFGFKIPVLARSDGEIVDGHLRLKAAQKKELTSATGVSHHQSREETCPEEHGAVRAASPSR